MNMEFYTDNRAHITIVCLTPIIFSFIQFFVFTSKNKDSECSQMGNIDNNC